MCPFTAVSFHNKIAYFKYSLLIFVNCLRITCFPIWENKLLWVVDFEDMVWPMKSDFTLKKIVLWKFNSQFHILYNILHLGSGNEKIHSDNIIGVDYFNWQILSSHSTQIEWKDNIISILAKVDVNIIWNLNHSSLFFVYVNPISVDIADIFKDDLWVNPSLYYVVTDMNDAYGAEWWRFCLRNTKYLSLLPCLRFSANLIVFLFFVVNFSF